MIMNTLTSAKAHQPLGVDVRWPVTLVTAQGHIEGEAQAITSRGMLISCLQAPPMEGSFQVLVKVPNRQTLSAIGKSVWTSIADVDKGVVRLGTEIEFSSISEGDRQFLQGIIAGHYQQKLHAGAAGTTTSLALRPQEVRAKDHTAQGVRVKFPVSYNQGGKSVEACGTNLTSQGCVIFSKKRPPAGGMFSLKIHNPYTGRLIQVDCSIVQCKHLFESKHWGTMLRFMHLTEERREEIRKIITSAPGAKDSRHQKTKIGQVIQKYFTRRKA
jgi:hypothetical protein